MVSPRTIWLLGTLRAEQDGRAITRFRTRQTGALLAYLALHRERAHRRDTLVDQLWPDDRLDAARHKLRLALSSLRQQLEPPGVPTGAVLIADRLSVQVNPASVATDVAEFEAALRAAERSPSPLERARLLSGAVELYRGELLSGYLDAWIVPERRRLEDAYFCALQQLAWLAEEQGDLAGAVRWARQAVTADPLREEAHQVLIRLLTAAGQRDAAARQYDELVRLLSRELGAVPSAETGRLLRDRASADELPSVSRRSGSASGAEAPPESRARPVAVPPVRLPMAVGTVTLLLGEITSPAAACRQALSAALEQHGGHLIRKASDSFLAAYPRATDALAAAVAAQRMAHPGEPGPNGTGPQGDTAAMAAEPSSRSGIRMALHTGEVEIHAGLHRGIALDHVVRVLLAAHPGQILCCEATAALLRCTAEPGKAAVPLDDLGLYRLAGNGAAESVPERLFQVRGPGMPALAFPAPQAPPAHAGQLPVPLTRFFGREEEIRRLRAMLADDAVRLVTLTGPGGSGKTRLALEVAKGFGNPFFGAVWFVPLAGLSDADRIPEAILHALNRAPAPDRDPLTQIAEALSPHATLLVLDNFEHVIEQGAEKVRTLLARIPGLTCLITSRQALDLSGEREFVVGPLAVPEEGVGYRVWGVGVGEAGVAGPHTRHPTPHTLMQFPSLRLFVDRAQAVRADFQLTPRNADAVAALCRRLEGMPLALELAAAWVRTVSPAQMLDQLDRRLDLLVSRKRDLPSRHQSLRAALDWSYHRLSPELQRFFVCLSVFRGGWNLAAAEAVCSDTHPASRAGALSSLDQLLARSLLQAEESGAETRYRMLESVREYAAEQLSPDEQTGAAARHARFFLALAERAEPELSGPEQAVWLDLLEAEHDNLRAALDGCVQAGIRGQGSGVGEDRQACSSLSALTPDPSPPEIGLRFIAALWWFWTVRGHWNEGEEQCRRILSLPGAQARTAGRARALNSAARMVRDPELVRALLMEALEIQQELGDREGMTGPLNSLGHIACSRGDYSRARALYEWCQAVHRELGNHWGAAMSLANQGKAAYFDADSRTARSLQERSLATMRELKDDWHVAYCLVNLGLISCSERRWDEATTHYREALRVLQDVEGRSLIIEALEGLGVIAEATGRMERAARLLAAAETLRAALGAHPIRPQDPGYVRYPAHALARRCEKEYPEAWAEGQRMSLAQMIVDAQESPDGGRPAA